MRNSRPPAPEPAGSRSSRQPSFVIRKADASIRFSHQVRLQPAPQLFVLSRRLIRAISTRGESSVLTDIEPPTGTAQRRIERLPALHRAWPHASGATLGYSKAARLGTACDLVFLDSQARRKRQFMLPNALSEVVTVGEDWYVGCRNGSVHAFDVDGKRLWRWTRDWKSDDPWEDDTFCYAAHPYIWVACWANWIAVIERRTVYVLDNAGNQRWYTLIPREAEADACDAVELPLPGQAVDRLVAAGARAQGLQLGLLRVEVSSANTASTEPACFRKSFVPCGSPEAETGPSNPGPRLRFQLSEPDRVATTAVAGTRDRLIVGTNYGKLHLFDNLLKLSKSFQLARGPVRRIVVRHNQLLATYGAGLLTIFDREQIRARVRMPEPEANVALQGDHLLVWKGHSAWLVELSGRVFWKADFAQPVAGTIATDTEFWTLSGTLACFRDTGRIR